MHYFYLVQGQHGLTQLPLNVPQLPLNFLQLVMILRPELKSNPLNDQLAFFHLEDDSVQIHKDVYLPELIL